MCRGVNKGKNSGSEAAREGKSSQGLIGNKRILVLLSEGLWGGVMSRE